MDRLEALHELTRAVNAAATLEQVFDRALDGLSQTLQLDRCSLLLFDPDGVMRFKAWRGLSDEYRARVEGHSPWSRDTIDPPPILVPDVRTEPSLASYLETFEQERIRALGFIPLVHHGELLGKFMIYCGEPHTFRQDEITSALIVANLIATVVDRDRREAALRMSRDQLSVILRAVTDGITVQTATGQLLYANEAAAKMTGFDSAEELVAAPVAEVLRRFEIVDEEGRPVPLEELPGRSALTGADPPDRIVRFRKVATGEERWSILSAAPVRNASGAVQFAVNVFRDVSDMQRARARMAFVAEANKQLGGSLDAEATAESLLELCVPALADYGIVHSVQSDGLILRTARKHRDPAKRPLLDELEERYPVDPAALTPLTRALRNNVSELTSLVPADVARTAKDQRHLQILEQLGTRQSVIVPLTARGRTIGAVTFGTAESGRSFTEEDLLLFESICRRAALAIDNGRLYAEAQEANRAKDEFLATLSHELRTPMTAIMGWASMLRLADVDPETFRLAVETIERSARAQSRIVDDILDMSKVVSGKLDVNRGPLDVSGVITEAVEGVRPAAAARNIDISVTTEPLAMLGDGGRLKQVLWNLLTNAIKFSAPGSLIEVAAHRAGTEAKISVKDNGQGMPPSLVPRIFERFQQGDASTNRAHGGLGLGLAIVRHIVEVHGGRVEAFSEGIGRGSTFTVWLPLLAASAGVAAVPEALPQLDGCRVLIVHGENDSRLLIESILTRCGAVTLSVDSVDSAVDACHTFGAHVVLSDAERRRNDAARFAVPEIGLRAAPLDPLELARTVARTIGR